MIGRAWAWIRGHAVALLGGMAVVLAAVLAWTLHRRKVGSLRDQIAVEKASRKVAALDARRQAIAEQEGDVAEEIAEVERERAEVQREAVSVARDVSGMDDAEVARAFAELYRRDR